MKSVLNMNIQKTEIIRTENCYVSEEDSRLCLESQSYYYGYISRETAEWLLWDEGCTDGLFLLRNSSNDYVLSLCHQKSVLHYRITKLKSGEFILQGLPQKKFVSVMALIECCEGLVCKPSRPMQASVGQCLPPTHWGLTIDEVRDNIILKAQDWGLTAAQLDRQLDCELHWTNVASPVVKSLVVSTLHEFQPWFHRRLSRIEAERRIQVSGHKDGKFLVRERDDCSYAICLSFETTAKHYRIDILPSGNFCIQDGPQFQSIIALVSHYTIWSSGLYCALSEPCRRPQSLIKDFVQQTDHTFKTSGRPRNRSLSMERTRNAINRTVRATTPTNIKIKEWFATINHKFNRIKKQTQEVLHNNNSRHHPLIQSDQYDYTGDISSLLTLRQHNHHRCCQRLSASSGGLIGRSHEEPVFGSGNIFDLNNDCLPQKTSHIRHTQNTNNSNRVCDQSIEFLHKTHQRLVRSSSIDTIQALMSDPSVESIRLMHSIPQPLTPPVPAPRKTLRPTHSTFNKVYVNQDVLQRTQSLDESNNCRTDCSHCSHCSECLIDLNQSTEDFDRILSHCLKSINENHNQNNEKSDQKTSLQSMNAQTIDLLTGNESKAKTTCAQELAEIFTNPLIDSKDPNQSISCDLLYDKNTNSLSSVVPNVEHQSPGSSSDSNDKTAATADKRTDVNCTATDPIQVINRDCDRNCGSDQINASSNDMKTITETNISSNIDLLKEFDICFNNSDNNQNNNNNNIETNSGLISNGSYEYDSIEIQNESIVKKASIGLADLNNTDSTSRVPLKQFDLICLSEEPEEVLQSLSKCKRGPLCLDSKCITIKRRIGNGYFGDVYLATIPCASSSAIIQLAVKMLKSNASQQQKADFLREAQVMSKLVHKHIVRLIGVCCGDPFMLCMELAPLGPLNRYLALEGGRHMTTDQLLQLMLQVAKAMNYLCGQNFVHRDLAARNVLLVSEQLAKVSDFGMSRAVEPQHDYYRASRASKWPLKWYAPECIYYYKFTHKSDVWSYGVTLWEVMARGQMPYQGMDGQDILRTIKDNKRLTKPDNCPVIIYQLMWNCWQFKPEDRPTFQQICDRLESYLASSKNNDLKH